MLGWTFLNPLFLWGIGLGAVPILLHLLQRRRYQVRPWAAMAFLQLSTRNTARRLRIEQLLLLMVRVAILVLAALALARPVVPPATGGAFSLLSRQDRIHATILLDHSYSMGVVSPTPLTPLPTGEGGATVPPSPVGRGVRGVGPDGGGTGGVGPDGGGTGGVGAPGGAGPATNWDRARQRALELIRDGLRPGDSLSVILAGSPPRALIRRPTFDLAEAARQIEAAALSDGGTDFARAARLCLETLKEASHPNREVYLITDNQAVGWGAEATRLWSELSGQARLHIVVVGERAPGNAAVADAGTAEGLVSTRRPAVIEARIVNHDDSPRAGLLATLVVNGRAGATTRVDLPARGEARARFTHLFSTPGVHAGSVRITPDRLPRDDEAFFRVQARDHLRVFCLNGRPSAEPRRDAAFYLAHALSPGEAGGPGDPGAFIRVTVASGALTPARLRDADVVVLADVPALPTLDARALTDFLRDGGGVLVFLGEGATGRGGRSAARGEREAGASVDVAGLLGLSRSVAPGSGPSASPLAADLPPRPLSLDSASLDHPILARFRNAGDVDLTTATFERRAPLAVEADGPLPEENRQAHVMARFSDGSPAWVETRVGRGRAIVVAHTAGVEGSTLPYKPAFVLLMHQAVAYLAQGPDAARRLTVGDRLAKTVQRTTSDQHPAPGTAFLLTDPDGQRTTLTASVLASDRAPSVRYDRTERAGHYRLTAPGEPAPIEVFAVNLPHGEADLRPISRAALAQKAPDARFTWIDPNQPLSAALRQARLGTELWRPLLIAVLVLMLLESFLAQRFGRQERAGRAAPGSALRAPRKGAVDFHAEPGARSPEPARSAGREG